MTEDEPKPGDKAEPIAPLSDDPDLRRVQMDGSYRVYGRDGLPPRIVDLLDARQRKFIEYLLTSALGNPAEAARLAGFTSLGAGANAMNHPFVQEALAFSLAEMRMTPEWARAGLVELCGSSMTNFLTFNDDGTPRLDFVKAACLGALGTIKSYEEKEMKGVITRKLVLYDKLAARTTLLKLHGLLKDRVDVTSNDQPIVTDPREVMKALLNDPEAMKNARQLADRLKPLIPDDSRN